MARRHWIQGLSPFSWEREAEMSAAKQRLLGRTAASPAQSRGRRSMWRVLGWSLSLAALAAVIFYAIAFKLRWLGIIGFYDYAGNARG
ncbi:MAG: hypothetical protein ABSD38_23630 [Syntrophorhabdales bacterium]